MVKYKLKREFWVLLAVIILIIIFVFLLFAKKSNNVVIFSHEKFAINFEKDVEINKVLNNIRIKDKNGTIIKTNINYFNNNKSIVLLYPPSDGYEANKIYTLSINIPNVNYNIEYQNSNTKSLKLYIKKDKEISFPDKQLQASVRGQINKSIGVIYYSDVYKITTFSAEQRQIKDLTGIENFVAIKDLYLGENQISDLSKLSNLKNLETLALTNNKITNIIPLRSLSKLKTLWFKGNGINDYGATTKYYKNLIAKDFELK